MIGLAGGQYLPADDGGEADARSTMNMEAESFYAAAKDADILFYSATVGGELESVEQLLAKAAWLRDFKAVQSGDVWCAEKDLFQQSSGVAVLIDEFHRIFSGAAETDALEYFHTLS
jgi:iron complex transport system substrate-binding protein